MKLTALKTADKLTGTGDALRLRRPGESGFPAVLVDEEEEEEDEGPGEGLR